MEASMRRTFVAIGVCLLSALNAKAQWSSPSGNGSYNGGRVGIGTGANPPANLLHIYSTAVADGLAIDGSSSPAITFKAAGSAQGYIGLPMAANNYFTGAVANDLTIRSESGNVLIGRCCASATLTVAGSSVGIGLVPSANDAKLHVAGDVIVDGNLAAKYQDVAEWVPAGESLTPGTVVVLDRHRDNEVVASRSAYDTAVAGVVSARPGLVLGERSETKAQIATTGRVMVRVDASRVAIRIGDLLVTSDVAGTAMKSQPIEVAGRSLHQPGTIIGKALQPLPAGKGEILVLLSLQ
jgi:hypothetical protein